MSGEGLRIFVVYKNPADYPGLFVVREWHVIGGAQMPCPLPVAVVATLDEARRSVPEGHVCFPAQPDDDPVIYEVWL